ncbi:hypothetical protein T439DRAFT_331352 [Meredithblackwellia eburnea MCA 4105]
MSGTQLPTPPRNPEFEPDQLTLRFPREHGAQTADNDVAMDDEDSDSDMGDSLDEGPIPDFEDETLDARDFEAAVMFEDDESKGEGIFQRVTRQLGVVVAGASSGVRRRGGSRKVKRWSREEQNDTDDGLEAEPGAGPSRSRQACQELKVLDKDYQGKLEFDPFLEQLAAERKHPVVSLSHISES